jgi:hypothetical protein
MEVNNMGLDRLVRGVVTILGVGVAVVWAVEGYNSAKVYEKLAKPCKESIVSTALKSEVVAKDRESISSDHFVDDLIFIGALPGRYIGYGVEGGIQYVEHVGLNNQYCK